VRAKPHDSRMTLERLTSSMTSENETGGKIQPAGSRFNQQERIDAANSKFERRRYSICTAAYRAQIVSS
jgi:hypothetical protein